MSGSMVRSLILALVSVVAGCSAGDDAPDAGAVAALAHAPAYRGPAVVTGKGDPAACPRKFDFDQYRNDMMNLRVDPDDPGYGIARSYDLHNRQCIELKKGERVDVAGGKGTAESLVRPVDESQTYWTAATWAPAEATGTLTGTVTEIGGAQKQE